MSVRILVFLLPLFTQAQSVDSLRMYDQVKITLDKPAYKNKNTTLVFYALPNGNSTEQTMGRKVESQDQWRFDIQHIKAQTEFLRKQMPETDIVVAYLENDLKSWPLWRQRTSDAGKKIVAIIDSVCSIIPQTNKSIYLNGHSGGGSFIFGYIQYLDAIPPFIKRIGFIDSNYGYDSSYQKKFATWLREEDHYLTVFAYNDSLALYNGKPVVSAKGGTWYRSHLMMQHLQDDFQFLQTRNDSLVFYTSKNKRIGFFFKTNPDQKIYHTQQVELNGFIHSILFGTKNENVGYEYYGKRAYQHFIPN